MKRIKDGFRLLGQSWQVVRAEPALVGVMALGLVLQLAAFAALFLLFFQRTPEAEDFRWPGILWLYPMMIASGLVGAVAGGTVIATAMQRLEGHDASVRDGFRLTMSRFPQLAGWTVFGSIVGIVINLIAERLKLAGRLTALLAGVAWVVVTMLVVPVLLFEDRGVFASIKRSAELVKQRWGEGVTGYGTMGVALMIVMVPLLVGAGALVAVDVALGVAVLVVVFLGTMFVASTLGGVFNAALYRYAAAGHASGPFSEAQLGSTFVTKEERQRPARRAWRIVGLVLVAAYLVMKLLQATDVLPKG
ncbi:MAG TPA: DUF6159 family protein [Actinomycetota bacterium]|nr:DUF6159 family protein [Actinomycetota bacterium]